MNRKVLLGALASVLVLGSLGVLPATVAHATGSTVSITPTSIAFGATSYRSTAVFQTVTVKNTGASPVTFQRDYIGGANPSEFNKNSDMCSFTSINPGVSCQLFVSFQPKAYPLGARTATLFLVDDATPNPQTVTLTGTSTFDPPIRQEFIPSQLPCCSVVNTKVQSITRGPGTNSSMWVTEVGQSSIGEFAPGSNSATNHASGAGSKPYGITVVPSDTTSVYFSDQNGNGRLAKMNVSTFAVSTLATFATAVSNPGNITAGPDGNIWGVEVGANKIFRYTVPGGVLSEYSSGIPAASGLSGIARGPGSDTSLYFTMATAGKLGKITTGATPTITILPTVLSASWAPTSIVAGPDSHMWVTLPGDNAVAQVNIDGTGLVLHALPTTNSHPVGIAADGLGNLYVTDAGKLSKLHFVSNVLNSISDIPMPANDTFSLSGLTWGTVATDASNNVWFSQWSTSSPTYTNGYAYQYSVTGTPAPAISPANPTVQFGNQADNSFSGDYGAYLFNSGTNDFHVTAATLGGADAASFHIVSDMCLGHSITPFQSCAFTVNFSPTAVRAYAATLTFTLTNAFGTAIASLVQSMAGTGTTQAPMTQYPIHASAYSPFCQGFCSESNLIANGPGSIVFVEPNVNRVGMLTTAGALSHWVVPTSGANPLSIAWDQTSPGNLWFTEYGAGQIGHLNLTTHAFTEYPIPTNDATPASIVFDPANGLMYFTASGSEGAFIDSITSTGVITEHVNPNAFSPGRLVVGGDGNIWAESSGTLLKMTPAGAFLTPPPPIGPLGSGLANGPIVNGKPTIWYASGTQVSYVTTDGTSAQATFVEPISLGSIQGLAQGTGNTMYLTIGTGGFGGNGDANKVAKVVATGVNTITGFVDQSIRHEDSAPAGITLGPDGHLWFLETNPGMLGTEVPF